MRTAAYRAAKKARDAKRDWKAIREANKARLREWGNKRREENKAYVEKLKESTPCADCGNVYKACQMQFDHVSGEKHMNVSTMLSGGGRALQPILDEIAKCDVVCANCHALRTWKWHKEMEAKGERWWRNSKTGKRPRAKAASSGKRWTRPVD